MKNIKEILSAVLNPVFLIYIAIILLAIGFFIYKVMSGWTPIDTTWHYDYAYILLPNGEVIEGKVSSWRDYDDGDQIQVKIDGKTYFTDTTRCVLIAE